MNKIFKVIWNHTTQTWIAVSELGKSKTKSKSQTNTTINLSKSLGLISLGTFGMAGTVLAAATADPITYDGTTATPTNTLYVTTSDKHVLVGKTAQGGKDTKINRSKEIVSIGFNTTAAGRQTIAIGSNATAAPKQTSDGTAYSDWGEAIAIGHNANANAHRSVAIGPDARTEGYPGSVAVGASAKVIGHYGTAVGLSARALGHYDIAIGNEANTFNLQEDGVTPVSDTTSAYNLAVGYAAQAKNGWSIAVGRTAKSVHQANALGFNANASGHASIAVGTNSHAIGTYSAAFGYDAKAKGWGDIALGLEAKATPTKGTGSVAIGQSAKAFGDHSGAIGAGNTIGGDANNELSGFRSFAVGASNTVKGWGTYVLGNNVSVDTNSSVILGDASSQTGSHTVGNVTGAVVTGVSYSGFTGKVKDIGRYVSIGTDANNTRKIINMAAGMVAHNSTEAINGSQLYLTHKAINDVNNNIPFDYTHKNNKKPLVLLADNNGNPRYYYEDELANYDYNPVTNTFTKKPTAPAGTANAPTAVAEDQVDITAKAAPKNVRNIKGNLPQSRNVGDKADNANTTPNATGVAATADNFTKKQNAPDVSNIYNNAATVGDVLNAGWNLKENDTDKDFVKPYDTVVFKNSDTTTVNITNTDGKTSTIKVDVITTELEMVDDEEDANYGRVNTPDDKAGKKLVNASVVAEAINNSGWKVTIGRDDDEFNDQDDAAESLVSMGETATFMSGKNLKVKQNLANITFATEDDVEFNSVQFNENGPKITNKDGNINVSDKDGGPVNVSNLKGNLAPTYNLGNPKVENGKADIFTPAEDKDDVSKHQSAPGLVTTGDIYNNAATAGDVLNAGWNLQNNGEAKDFVKPYDTVNFVDSKTVSASVVTDESGLISNVSFNVNTGEAGAKKDGALENKLDPAEKTKAREKVKELEIALTQAEGELPVPVNNVDQAKLAVAEKQQAFETAQQNLDNAKQEYDTKKTEFKDASTALDDAKREVKRAESEEEKKTANETLKEAQDAFNEAKKALTAAEKDVTSKEGKLKKAFGDLKDSKDDFTKKETALAAVNDKIAKAKADLAKAKAAQDQLDNQVATVKNVVEAVNNSGFNIFQDDTADDNHKALVNPGDKVVYKAAGEARVNVSKEKDGVTNITYRVDLPVVYTDKAGNKLLKGEDGKFYTEDQLADKEYIIGADGTGKYYPKGSVVDKDGNVYQPGSVLASDGKVYAPNTKLNADGTPNTDNGQPTAGTKQAETAPTETPKDNVIASMNSFATDPKTGKETTATAPMGLSNVAQGTNTIGDKTYTDPNPNPNKPDAEPETLVKVGDKYYKADDLENGVPKAGKTPVEADAAGTAPVTSAVDKAKAGLADLANSNANNALTVADAKNLGWVVSSNKTTGDLGTEYAADVRNANEVRFVGTGLATVSGETKDNVRIITVDVNAQTVAEKAQLPVVYTDKDGNKLVKGKDGEFYKPEEIADKEYITDKDGNNGKYYPKDSVLAKDGKVYPAEKVDQDGNLITNNGADAPKAVDPVEPAKKGDVIASMNNGNNESKDAPMNLANLKGNLPQTVNVGDTPEKVGADGKTTGKLDPAGTPATARTQRQDAPKAEEVAKIYNNAATVGDVLNSGWNLGINGDKKDFVKAYDTVNFVNGNGTLASVETNEKGDVSNVTFNIDKGTVKTLDSGKLEGISPADKTKLDEAVTTATAAIEPAKKAVKDKETALETAKAELVTSPDSEEVKQKVAAAEKDLKDAQKELAEKESLKAKAERDVAAVPNKVATVENVVEAVNKSGFTIYQDSENTPKKALVNPGDKVVYAAEGLATVTVDKETDAGVTKITYKVDAQAIAETAQLPVVYTDKYGNKLVKGKDGKFYKPEEIADKVFIDGKYYPADSVKANDGKVYPKSKVGEDGNVIQTNGNNPNEAIAVEPYTTSDVIASMNNGENNTITPMSLSNVQGNLPQTVNKGDRKEDPTLKVLTDGKADTATKSAFAPNNIGDIYNNAATVGDVLNSGWNLKNNGEAKDFVKPYDTVNFIDTKTVSAKVETNESGLISNVSFSVNTGEAKVEKNGKVVNSVKETDKTEKEADVAKKAEALKTTKTDLTTAEATRDEKKTAFDTAKANYDKEQESLKKEKEALAANPSDPLAVGKVKVAEIALKQKADELEKAKKALEEAENAVDEKQALVDAAQGALDKAKTARTQLDNQVATVKNVVDAINGSGFNIFQDDATEGNHKALVNPGDKVVYAAEGLAKVEVTDEQDGVTKITYKVDAQAVAETAQLPVVYTDKDGNKLVKGEDGKFYPADSVKIDGKYYPAGSVKAKDGNVYPADKVDAKGELITTPGADAPTALEALKPKATGDVIASMNNAAGSTTNPMALTNIASNLSPVDTKVVFTETGVPVANPFDGKSAPALSKALENPDSPLRNNAATIGDVLNAGWNLQGNGEAKDFVRHTDTVNFVNGVGTTVSVTTDDKQKVSEIRVNSLVGLTAQDGTPVIKGPDNKFYKVDANGQPDKTQPVEAGKLVANVINPAAAAPNEKGDPLQLGNIAAGAKTFDNEVGGNLGSDPVTLANDGKWYPADQVEATGKPKADATAIPAPKGDNIKAGLIDFDNSKPNNALTVEDARNLGWIVSTSENQYADQVRNANKVNFKGKDGISVTGETNADGVREITIALKKGEVISSNGEKPKTKDNNTPLTKVGDQYFKTTDVEGGVVKVGDSYYKADDVETKDGVTKPKDNVTALTPITSDNVTSGDAGAGFVTGNQVGDAIQASGFTVGKSTTATLPTTFDNKDEKVNPDDNLRFADGKGIKVSLGTVKAVDNDGVIKTTTTVKVDIDNAKLENNTDGSVKDIADPTKLKALRDAEKKVADAKQAVKDANQAVEDAKKAKADAAQAVIDAEKALTDNQDPAKADELQKALDAAKEKAKDPKLDTAIKEAKDAAAKPELADAVKAAEAELAKNPTANQVATAQNVADAINNSGFTLKASAVENKGKLETGTADKTKGELINPGKTVEMIAGKNMSVKHDKNGQITYATKDDVNFDSVQFGDNGPKIQRDGDNIKVSNSTGGPTKITNVAPGTADTDAVNVKQLKEAVGNINNNFGDINNRVNKLDKRMRGIGANVAAAASLPQVYIPGKSMISAAAGGYNGASAVAVGYSRASDNGKLILKLTGTANSTGQYSGGVGVGYQW